MLLFALVAVGAPALAPTRSFHVRDAILHATRLMQQTTGKMFPDDWFDMIPELVGLALPGGPPTKLTNTLTSPCWTDVSVSASALMADASTISFDAKRVSKTSETCHDFYLIMTVESLHIHEMLLGGSSELVVSGMSEREAADVAAGGFRIFHFAGTEVEMLEALAATAMLFLGEATQGVSKGEAERNIAWLRDYMPGALDPHFGEVRPANLTDIAATLPEEAIRDGDMLCVLRFDGLDPLINWGTGGNCGV